jgi:hypothetical protein
MHFREESWNGVTEVREQIGYIKDETYSSINVALSRTSEFESRCKVIEGNISENNMFHAASIDKLNERLETSAKACEAVRLNAKYQDTAVARALERVKEIEGLHREYDTSMRDLLQREKTLRDESVRRIQKEYIKEFDAKKFIVEVEKRLTVRLERESAEREKNFKAMIDEVKVTHLERKPPVPVPVPVPVVEQKHIPQTLSRASLSTMLTQTPSSARFAESPTRSPMSTAGSFSAEVSPSGLAVCSPRVAISRRSFSPVASLGSRMPGSPITTATIIR